MGESIWEKIYASINSSHKKIQLDREIVNTGENPILNMMPVRNPVLEAVVVHMSGLSIDNWFYILGCGSNAFYGISDFNINFYQEGLTFIAYDVLGGLFALNNGKFDAQIGEIWYFAPDTLEWESLGMDYDDFLIWALQGDTDEFYKPMRWDSWNNTVSDIKKGEMVLVYPFVWSQECDVNKAAKKVVPCKELIELNFEYAEKIYG